MTGRPRNPESKHTVSAKTAARKLIKVIDEERPTPVEIYGIPPCPLLPHGQIGLAELNRDPARLPKPDSVTEAGLIMLPFGRGKLLGNQ